MSEKYMQLKAVGLFKYVWPFATVRHLRVKVKLIANIISKASL